MRLILLIHQVAICIVFMEGLQDGLCQLTSLCHRFRLKLQLELLGDNIEPFRFADDLIQASFR